MPRAAEVLDDLERLRSVLERRWHLPWCPPPSGPSLFENRVVGFLEALPDDLFDDVVDRLIAHDSFALRGLGLHLGSRRRPRRFAEAARGLLDDDSVHVRAMAAALLGASGSASDLEALLETKDGEHPEVKKSVVDALKRIRDTRSIPLLTRWVGRAGEDDELRSKVCQALGVIADDAAMPVLSRVLDDDTVGDEVRGDAIQAIARIGGPEARAFLRRGLTVRRPWVRAHALRALIPFRDRGFSHEIQEFLADAQPWMVRVAAIDALSAIGGADAAPHVAACARATHPRVRLAAVAALARIGGDLARSTAHGLLDDSHDEVRIQALLDYERLTGQDFGGHGAYTPDPASAPVLAEALLRARAFGAPPAAPVPSAAEAASLPPQG